MSARDDAPDGDAEFRADLRALLRRAHESGVDVRGGWECRNGDGDPDWDVVVTEVEKRGDSDPDA
jgi:hypothetical protein